MKTIHKLISVYLAVTGLLVFMISVLYFSYTSTAGDSSSAFPVIASAVSLAGLFVFLYLYRKNILTPLEHITSATTEIRQGQFHSIPLIKNPDMRTIAGNLYSIDRLINDNSDELEKTFHREKNALKTMSSLSNLNKTMSGKEGLQQFMEIILASGTEIIKSEAAAIAVIDRRTFQVTNFISTDKYSSGNTDLPGKALINELVNSRKPLMFRSAPDASLVSAMSAAMNIQVKNLLAVPVLTENELAGALIFINSSDRDGFTIEHKNNASFLSYQAAMVIEKARLHEAVTGAIKADELTGLDNYAAFIEKLYIETRRSERFARPLSVLIVDIDFLDKFNNAYGIHNGNAAIKEISAILKASLRKIDIISRYSSDAFGIILPETSPEGARLTAERIKRGIGTHAFSVDENMTYLTVSIGISTFPDDSKDAKALLQAAAEAVSSAKAGGRNRIAVFSECKEEKADDDSDHDIPGNASDTL